jgi:hypothetical protein
LVLFFRLVIGNLKAKAVIQAMKERVNGFAETDVEHPVLGKNAAQEKAKKRYRHGGGCHYHKDFRVLVHIVVLPVNVLTLLILRP